MLALAGMIPMQPVFARQPAPDQPDTTVYTHVKQMPTYQGGGIERFTGWMYEELQYPQEAIAKGVGGEVNLRFVVETDGTLGDVQIETSDERLSDEVIRVLKRSECWEPGRSRKQPARVELRLTIQFDRKDTTVSVGRMPMFLGGDLQTFREWIIEHTNYPPDALKQQIAGKIVLSFVVEKDGSVDNFELLESNHPGFTREGLRVVRSAPNWTPGIRNGDFVRVKYTLPILFHTRYY